VSKPTTTKDPLTRAQRAVLMWLVRAGGQQPAYQMRESEACTANRGTVNALKTRGFIVCERNVRLPSDFRPGETILVDSAQITPEGLKALEWDLEAPRPGRVMRVAAEHAAHAEHSWRSPVPIHLETEVHYGQGEDDRLEGVVSNDGPLVLFDPCCDDLKPYRFTLAEADALITALLKARAAAATHPSKPPETTDAHT